MKSYWFSIVLPVAVQILVVSMATVFPPVPIFSGKLTLADALDNALFTAIICWPLTWILVFLSFPFAYIQMVCAKSMAREHRSRLTLFFVGLLNFAIAILLIAIVLTLWFFRNWRP
jgi:hypothetical protein